MLKTTDMAFMGALHPFIRSFLGKNKIKTEKVTEVAIRNNIPINPLKKIRFAVELESPWGQKWCRHQKYFSNKISV